MTQKDLFKYQDTKKLYTEAKERLAEFEMTIYSPPSPTLDGMPKSHDDSNPEHLTETVARHDELIALCNARLLDYIRAGRILDQAETVLTPVEVTIIEKRYRHGLSLEKLAPLINYERSQVFKIHARIIKKIADL
jgi:DNA-directed RNA polymerase specialized sigma subunit